MDINLFGNFHDDVQGAFLLLVGIIAIVFVVRRHFMGLIGFFVLAAIVGVFVFFPESIAPVGKRIFDAVIGG